MDSEEPLADVGLEIVGLELIAPWDGRRVPVTLLGGYLGAGKTTVINEVLARTDQPIAVLVNDVGSVNVDASLVRRRHGDTIELTDGCVCCSLAGGLAEAFDGLRDRDSPPDHVIVELSGIADPARVAPWASSPGFSLDGVVVLVDADQFPERFSDPATADSVKTQLGAADLVVLSKLDIAAAADVAETRSILGDCIPGVPVLSSDDAVATASFVDLATRRPGGVADTGPANLFDAHEVSTVAVPRPIARAEFEAMIDALSPSTLRAKGIAVTPDGTRLLAQVVGRRRCVTVLPDAESQPPTDLVVISPRS
ncbi:MAG: CobW family GTP-binding protein [Acidimicrobiaceae bacterium]|nr:CobW family GTP-binding protein [Acidimicrobiaceae bacterium]